MAYDGTGSEFVFTRPTPWSEQRIIAPPVQPRYGGALDMHPDGTWLAAAVPAVQVGAPAPRNTIEFVFNLRDLLRTRR